MAKKISSSVGKGGKNKPEDVKIVQELLNAFTKMCGFKKLDEDGLIGPKTISAIAEFQKTAVGMSKPDSRIDTNGDSFSVLSKGPKKAEAELKKSEEAEKEKKEAAEAKKAKAEKSTEVVDKGKAQVRGETRGVDKKILAVLEAVSAYYGKPIHIECGKQDASGPLNADQLWQDWETKLGNGDKVSALKGNSDLLKELKRCYVAAEKKEFDKCLAKLSGKSNNKASEAHAAGRAIDISKNTDRKMVDALSTILRYENEGNVIHFDDGGKSIPKAITEDMKKKWK
jgi:hypothetical protein